MKDNDIIKALECHTVNNSKRCQVCPYTIYGCYCLDRLHPDLLDLITRQQAEIESLKIFRGYAEKRASDYRTMRDKYLNAKSEAVKEFAERLKNKWFDERYDSPDVDFDDFIDNLLKDKEEVLNSETQSDKS